MANGRRGHGEGSIFQRKTDWRWIGQADLGWSEGKRKRRFVTGTSRKDVQERLANLVREHQLGLLPKGGKVTTGAFLQSWLDEIATPRVRPSTLQRYRELTAHWSDLNRIPLEKVSASDVQRVLNAKSKQMAARTVHHMRSVLRTALNAALRRQLITRNAASLADPPRVVRAELAVLTEGQASALLTAIKGGPLESLVKIALSLGLRRGEALGLRWCDVDLEVGILRVSHALQRINKKQLLVEPKFLHFPKDDPAASGRPRGPERPQEGPGSREDQAGRTLARSELGSRLLQRLRAALGGDQRHPKLSGDRQDCRPASDAVPRPQALLRDPTTGSRCPGKGGHGITRPFRHSPDPRHLQSRRACPSAADRRRYGQGARRMTSRKPPQPLTDEESFPERSPDIWQELAKDKFSQQMSDHDAIDSKLGLFLSAGSAVIGIQLAVFALQPSRFGYWPIRSLIVAVATYGVLSVAALIGLMTRRWAVGPKVRELYAEAIEKKYDDSQVGWKIASRYQTAYEENEPKVAWKVRGLKLAVSCLVVETLSVAFGLFAVAHPL